MAAAAWPCCCGKRHSDPPPGPSAGGPGSPPGSRCSVCWTGPASWICECGRSFARSGLSVRSAVTLLALSPTAASTDPQNVGTSARAELRAAARSTGRRRAPIPSRRQAVSLDPASTSGSNFDATKLSGDTSHSSGKGWPAPGCAGPPGLERSNTEVGSLWPVAVDLRGSGPAAPGRGTSGTAAPPRRENAPRPGPGRARNFRCAGGGPVRGLPEPRASPRGHPGHHRPCLQASKGRRARPPG